jgi:hypothetical protein
MPSNVVNRQTIREALATKIDAALDATWDVYNYATKAVAFEKARNVVIATDTAHYPEMGAAETDSDFQFTFLIALFILYADDAQSWTAQNSEDALDLGRKLITDVLKDNIKNGSTWDDLRVSGPSRVSIVSEQGGEPYRFESIPVTIKKYS